MSLEPAPPPPSFARFGRIGAIVALIVVAGVAVVGGASYLGREVGGVFSNGPEGVDVEPGIEVEIVIPAGASAQDIAAILSAQGVISSATGFEGEVRSAGVAADLRAGTYRLVTGMEEGDVIAQLTSGPVADAIRVTIREGLRVEEIVAELAEITSLPAADFTEALQSGDVTTELADIDADVDDISAWEGLLFPDTYEFSLSATPESMLQRLASTMEQRVDSVDWSAFEDAGFSRYEGVVIASLIESEVRVADERARVSSVIRNRLDDEMRLQIDATVLYALDTRDPAEFDGEVDSPYNTYQNAGLPPTPISAPGLASLQAAAAPAETDFLYYVLSNPDGSHTFTETLEEHNAAVQRARDDGVLP